MQCSTESLVQAFQSPTKIEETLQRLFLTQINSKEILANRGHGREQGIGSGSLNHSMQVF